MARGCGALQPNDLDFSANLNALFLLISQVAMVKNVPLSSVLALWMKLGSVSSVASLPLRSNTQRTSKVTL